MNLASAEARWIITELMKYDNYRGHLGNKLFGMLPNSYQTGFHVQEEIRIQSNSPELSTRSTLPRTTLDISPELTIDGSDSEEELPCSSEIVLN